MLDTADSIIELIIEFALIRNAELPHSRYKIISVNWAFIKSKDIDKNQAQSLREAKRSIHSLSKQIICGFIVFGALFIGFSAFNQSNQAQMKMDESRQILTAKLPLYLHYRGQPVSLEVDADGTVQDIFIAAAEALSRRPNTFSLIVGEQTFFSNVNTNIGVADCGLCAEAAVIVDTSMYDEFEGKLANCRYFRFNWPRSGEGDKLTAEYEYFALTYVEGSPCESVASVNEESVANFLMSQGFVKSNFTTTHDEVRRYVVKELSMLIKHNGEIEICTGIDNEHCEKVRTDEEWIETKNHVLEVSGYTMTEANVDGEIRRKYVYNTV